MMESQKERLRDSDGFVRTEPVLEQIVQSAQKKRGSERAAEFLGIPHAYLNPFLRKIFRVPADKAAFTNDELIFAISLIARYELDPFTKQIYVYRGNKGEVLTTIGYDGWVQILSRQEGYDGFEYFEEHDDKGNLISVEYVIHDRGRKYPGRYKGLMRGWRPPNAHPASFWGKNPEHMLHKTALAHAARRTYPIGVVYASDEISAILEQQDVNTAEPEFEETFPEAVEVKAEPEKEPEPEKTADELFKEFIELTNKLSPERIEDIKAACGIETLSKERDPVKLAKAVALAKEKKS